MKSGRIGVLLGVLALLLVIAWLSGVFDKNYSTLDVPDWDLEVEDVRGLEVLTKEDTISVVRTEGRWMMVAPFNAAADSMHVRRLLDNLADLEFGSLVTANPSRHGKYGVDSAAAQIVVRLDEEDVQVTVGDQTPDFLGTFIRLGDDSRVFATSQPIRLTSDLDQWRDKVVVNVPASAVTSAKVKKSDGGSYSLDLSSGEWRLRPEGGVEVSADSAGVMRWVRRYAPLRGDGFVEDAEDASPLAVVTFETSGGSTIALEVMETASHLVMRRPSDGAVLRVSSGRKASLLPDGSTFGE
ncbi:MAG: DUF4340 domain-containing protein [Rhodothermia bacterium]|nr:DUF4340 domain-containing protein [Rhodothermia bacterium]